MLEVQNLSKTYNPGKKNALAALHDVSLTIADGEMVAVTGLKTAPAFCPIVAPFYSGMLVTVVLDARDLQNGKTAEDVKALYRSLYHTPIVSYADAPDEEGFLSAAKLSTLDRMEISVFGNSERILLAARYDNLGKGASGAALECMNIVMGLAPEYGLEL